MLVAVYDDQVGVGLEKALAVGGKVAEQAEISLFCQTTQKVLRTLHGLPAYGMRVYNDSLVFAGDEQLLEPIRGDGPLLIDAVGVMFPDGRIFGLFLFFQCGFFSSQTLGFALLGGTALRLTPLRFRGALGLPLLGGTALCFRIGRLRLVGIGEIDLPLRPCFSDSQMLH